ncbi:MAG: aminotransferase class I/II-fold pyridoxal phosphate-dependent enzyme, partial [Candidatus Eiseniibacteriota bacterium]
GYESFLARFARNLGYNRLSESLALAALESAEYYERVRSQMATDRARITGALRALDRVRAYDSDANFVLARFPTEITESLDEELRRRNIIIKFFKERGFLDCARITIGTGEETSLVLDSLGEILSNLLAATP